MERSTQKNVGIGTKLMLGVEPLIERPHGIRYNLTLHDNNNQHILGFDNAHGIKVKKGGKYCGRVIQYDHVHKGPKDQGEPYEFVNAEQLLKDFFNEVTKIIEALDGGGM